jgi:WD40-like Beta Propeller Repeat
MPRTTRLLQNTMGLPRTTRLLQSTMGLPRTTRLLQNTAPVHPRRAHITLLMGGLFLAVIHFVQPTKAQSTELLREELLWDFQMVGAPQVSPDGKSAVYSVRYNNLADNKGQSDLFLLDLTTGISRRLTQTPGSEHSYSWRPDGQRIGYLSSAGGSSQLWEMMLKPSAATRKASVDMGIVRRATRYFSPPRYCSTAVCNTATPNYPNRPACCSMA